MLQKKKKKKKLTFTSLTVYELLLTAEQFRTRRKKKHSAAPPGIEPGSSDCWSDALTTELRSHDRNCVQIFVFHQTVSSFSLRGDPHVRAYKHVETDENSLFKSKIRSCRDHSILSNSFLFSIRKMWTDSWIRRKKNTAQPRRGLNLGLPDKKRKEFDSMEWSRQEWIFDLNSFERVWHYLVCHPRPFCFLPVNDYQIVRNASLWCGREGRLNSFGALISGPAMFAWPGYPWQQEEKNGVGWPNCIRQNSSIDSFLITWWLWKPVQLDGHLDWLHFNTSPSLNKCTCSCIVHWHDSFKSRGIKM